MKSFNLYKNYNKSFSVKAFIKITFFIVIISFSFTIFFVLQESKSATDNLIRRGELLAKLLAYNSRLGVFAENENLLINPVRGLLHYDEVLSVTIFNLEGKLLIKQEIPGREKQGESVESENRKDTIEKIKKAGSFFYREGSPDTFEFWIPVTTGVTYPNEDALYFDKKLFPEKDRIIGFVQVILDKSILNKQLKDLLFKGILIGIIFSIIGAAVTYLMVKRITKPIEKLGNASSEIGKGNLEVKVEIESDDEIGRLAASFNKMAMDLKEHRDHLEELVKERTAELTRTNEQLQSEITERKQVEEKLLNYQDQLRTMASELSLTEERERRRIASELHDRIGQSLAISKIDLGALRKELSSSELAGTIEKIYELITLTIQDTRSLIFELSPPILYELGFEAAVEWLAEQIKEQHNILVEFEDDNQLKPLDNDLRVVLFQAVRELLINIVKHSQARNAKVSLGSDESTIQIKVEDDGVGFDISRLYTQDNKSRGFGLFSIFERMDYLGGHFEIVSKPGHGTMVTLVAPLKRDEGSINGELYEHKDSLS
ncbi:MAG: HAMP domain-containing protein [Nitrospirota bacterium]|nr:HAMP domain-containing protein [Nitrospirota bacterium]MDH5769213.1 HAMP domain-containing protein [Nitrospirota bacterium]